MRQRQIIFTNKLMTTRLLELYETFLPFAGADRESDGLGAPFAVTGLSNLGKAWLFLDF